MHIYLASKSPRRKELLKLIFDSFEIIPSGVEEEIRYKKPYKIVEDIARQKLNLSYSDSDSLVISCDTIVYFKRQILGKPKSEEHAFQMLKMLQGEWHTVYSGVNIAYNKKTCAFYDTSKVLLRHMSDNEIKKYIKGGSPIDKAGAYGVQDGIAEKFKGSYYNVMGLPVEKLREKLINMGIRVKNQVE